MQVRMMLLVPCLLSTNHISTMDYKGPIDPQTQSALSTVPGDIMPKLLWMNTVWATVRAVLALQQTCQHWHKLLNVEHRKKMVGLWLNEGKDLDEQNCLHLALQMIANPHFIAIGQFRNPHFTPEMFLLAGAQVNSTTEYGDSPLMFAVNTQDYSMPHIQMLIEMGAKVNHQNNDGDTALHLAVRQRLVPCVEVLLQNRADTTLKNRKGEIPIGCIDWTSSPMHFVHRERIQSLLDGTMTPEASIANPIVVEVWPSAKDALDQFLDTDDSNDSGDEYRDWLGISVSIKKPKA
jgi:hypothetical protein